VGRLAKNSAKLFGRRGNAAFLVVLGAGSLLFASRAFFAAHDAGRSPEPTPNDRAPAASAPLTSYASTPPPICNRFYETVCQKRGAPRDPTGIVRPDLDGEILALRIYEEIIHKHPDWASDQVDEELVKRVYTPKRLDRVREAHAWVRAALERYLQAQPERILSAEDKTRLIARVQAVKLDLPPPASAYADEPDLFTKNDVYYERTSDGTIRMRVGGAYLFTAKSRFNLIFTVAHEFAHSIDPCELKASGLEIKAYHNLTACFRDRQYVSRAPNILECSEGDQTSETFADWIAVQVTAEALKSETVGYTSAQLVSSATNAVRDLCEQDDSTREVDVYTHPEPRVRIEHLFGNQAEIRAVLGCPALAQPDLYCTFESATSPGAHP
jgi:hypothetical protein